MNEWCILLCIAVQPKRFTIIGGGGGGGGLSPKPPPVCSIHLDEDGKDRNASEVTRIIWDLSALAREGQGFVFVSVFMPVDCAGEVYTAVNVFWPDASW